MLELIFAMFFWLVWQITRESIRAGIRKMYAPKPKPHTCSMAQRPSGRSPVPSEELCVR